MCIIYTQMCVTRNTEEEKLQVQTSFWSVVLFVPVVFSLRGLWVKEGGGGGRR